MRVEHCLLVWKVVAVCVEGLLIRTSDHFVAGAYACVGVWELGVVAVGTWVGDEGSVVDHELAVGARWFGAASMAMAAVVSVAVASPKLAVAVDQSMPTNWYGCSDHQDHRTAASYKPPQSELRGSCSCFLAALFVLDGDADHSQRGGNERHTYSLRNQEQHRLDIADHHQTTCTDEPDCGDLRSWDHGSESRRPHNAQIHEGYGTLLQSNRVRYYGDRDGDHCLPSCRRSDQLDQL